MPIIELKDVSKLYGFGDATTVAIEEVSLSIEPNEFVAVMGPSGSGKSTLMNVIGLLDQPTHGIYQLMGKATQSYGSGRRAKFRRDSIGFVFQSFNLLPKLTVLDNVALPLAYKGVGTVRRRKRAEAMLARIGLTDRTYFLPSQLSGGQAQRVAIARALINEPQIIIADEPTGNLDSVSSRVVMELLSEIHKNGSTILMVTHNPELTRYANRVLFMHDGSLIADEKTAIGDVPELARSMYFLRKKTVDDDLAGISALMQAVQQGAGGIATALQKKTKKRAAKPKRRTKFRSASHPKRKKK